MKKIFIGLIFSLVAMTFIATDNRAFSYNLDDATNYYNQGIDFYSQNEVENSINSFQKAIVINPDFYEAYYNLGKIQLSYGKYEAAIKTYKKLLELSPEDWESVYDMATACYKAGHLANAAKWLSSIPQSASNYKEASEFLARVKVRQAVIAAEIEQTMATIQAPSGVSVDSFGNLYVASFAENKVYLITPDKKKSVFVDEAYLGGPIGLVIDDDNTLYIANYTKNNIVKVTQSGVIAEFTKIKKPYCLAIDRVKKLLMVSEQDKNKVLKFAL